MTLRDAAVLLPAASAALTERTTWAFPPFMALRSLTSALLESLSVILAVLPKGAVALARPRTTFFVPIRTFATTASLHSSLQRADSASIFVFSARWIRFAASVSFGAVVSEAAGGAGGLPGPAGAASSSVIVTVAPAGERTLAPPPALESVTWIVSLPAYAESLVTGTVKVLPTSPGPNVSVPLAAA